MYILEISKLRAGAVAREPPSFNCCVCPRTMPLLSGDWFRAAGRKRLPPTSAARQRVMRQFNSGIRSIRRNGAGGSHDWVAIDGPGFVQPRGRSQGGQADGVLAGSTEWNRS